jgi:hypothetical protein
MKQKNMNLFDKIFNRPKKEKGEITEIIIIIIFMITGIVGLMMLFSSITSITSSSKIESFNSQILEAIKTTPTFDKFGQNENEISLTKLSDNTTCGELKQQGSIYVSDSCDIMVQGDWKEFSIKDNTKNLTYIYSQTLKGEYVLNKKTE